MSKHAVSTAPTNLKAARPTVPHAAPDQDEARVRGDNRRLDLFSLLSGLVDARASGVDFLDTVAGEELARLFRGRHSAHGHPKHRRAA